MIRPTDLVIAVVLTAGAVVERLVAPESHFVAATGLDLLVIVAAGALLAVRGPLPGLAVWGILATWAVQAAVLSPPQTLRVDLGLALVLGYVAGQRPSGREVLLWAIVLVGVIELGTARSPDAIGSDFLFYPAIGIGAVIAGRAARNRSRLVAELERQATELDDHAATASRRAVAEERRRIAHELHDVVAHAISVMVVQAGAGRRVLATDAERAAEAAAQVERTGREALLEMRRLLAVLREPDAPAEREPNPTLDGLPTLVERLAADGMHVTMHASGRPRPVPAGLGLGAYRVVQDALDDVARVAPGAHTVVDVRWGEEDLLLRVRDDRPVAAEPEEDAGLLGVRERVAVYGGSFDRHDLPGGGHEVVVRLPLDPVTAPQTTGGAA